MIELSCTVGSGPRERNSRKATFKCPKGVREGGYVALIDSEEAPM